MTEKEPILTDRLSVLLGLRFVAILAFFFAFGRLGPFLVVIFGAVRIVRLV